MGNPIAEVFFGLVWLIAGLLLLSHFWSWITAFSAFVTDDYYSTMYWIGLIGLVISVVIVPPFALILKAFQGEEGDD